MRSESRLSECGLAPRTRSRVRVCHIGLCLLITLNAALQTAVAGSPPIVGWGHNYYGHLPRSVQHR